MKKNLLTTCALATISMVCAPLAIAQDTDDEIVVTGSFIKRKNQGDLPSPLQTVGASDIEDIAAFNIADITQTLTINTGAQNNPDAFTQNATTGTSNINLRGLGVGSTLVLLNGKRQVLSGSPTNDGINFVDTASLVPLIAVERVEILKDGASALYGSDAVAGVVNFLTVENYDGIRLSGDYTTHQSEGDYDEFNIQGLIGKDFGRGSVILAASYLDRSALTTEERRLSVPFGVGQDTSSLGNPGAFFGLVDGNDFGLGGPVALPFIDPGCAAAGGNPGPASVAAAPLLAANVGFCQFDFGDFFNLVPDEERFTGFARAEFELTDSIEWTGEFGYANNEAVRGNSPSFPFLQTASSLIPGNSLIPAGLTPNPFNILADPFDPTNQENPTVVFFGRVSGNGGTVSPNLTESETWRFSTSLGGDIGSGNWEVSFTRADNNFVVATEDTVVDRFQCSLLGFSPASINVGTDCTSSNPTLTAQGGIIPSVGTFFNPFSTAITDGVNAEVNAGLIDFIQATQIRDFESDLTVIEGFVSQELFQLPAGPLSVAVGAQYRDNDLSQEVDELSAVDAFGFLVGGRDFDGSQDVFAFFGEASVPITDWIDLQVAVRHERYGEDEGGSTTDPKVALLVRPADNLSLRGSFSTSFRAPSVFQQFGESTTLQQVSDAGATAFVAVRTLAPEVNGEITAREILPEESEAFNFGATWQPFDGLQLDIDYFNFDFSNVIIATAPQAILDAANAGDAVAEAAVIRSPAGTVLQINNDFVNASSVETSGLDFNASYSFETGFGTFTPTFTGTYIINYDIVDPQAGAIDGEGVRNFNNFGSPTPQLRFNAGLAWRKDAHSFNLFVRHIGSYLDDQNCANGAIADSDAFPDSLGCPVGIGLADIRSDTRVDIQYSVAINEYLNSDRATSFTVGVRNATGTRAPFVQTNGGFDSRVADPRGALLYFGLDLEF